MAKSWYRRFLTFYAIVFTAILCECAPATFEELPGNRQTVPHIATVVNTALSWRIHSYYTPSIAGVTLLRDGAPFAHRNLAVAHSIERSNPRLSRFDALELADIALDAATRHALDGEFFCATLLQESAFDPTAMSSAGAVGIAQFTIDTADRYGVDPFDPNDAIEGAAALLGRYLAAYRGVYDDPYAAALAAYNAGPGAVAAYRGVPPYPETREYVADVYERWAYILHDERKR
ncbi:MAG: lytic transglycosylase domain-containing protein [Candidatus Eremiobacteraeota bacterium]|nr:lytic transglycosylase domain-containing protein [Candidatus Eremiobacteraeota bacterium]